MYEKIILLAPIGSQFIYQVIDVTTHKKHARKTKTNAEIKASSNKYKNKKLQEDKKNIKALVNDRMETQANIGEAISSVYAISKTLADERVIEILSEDTHKKCVERIEEFKNVVNKTTPVIKECLKNMEDLEKKMLNDIRKKDEYWTDYSLQGIAMIEATNELTCSSLNTTTYCAANLTESLDKLENKND